MSSILFFTVADDTVLDHPNLTSPTPMTHLPLSKNPSEAVGILIRVWYLPTGPGGAAKGIQGGTW